MIEKILKEITNSKRKENTPDFVIKNYLKEYLQYPVLDFIYNSKDYKNFIFTGGSCIRICFGAPRLSEDLDFDLYKKDYEKIDISKLAELLKENFQKKYMADIKIKCQSDKRIYLKFPILKELGLSNCAESDFLYVKVEISKTNFKKPDIELSPVSCYGFNFIARTYTLPFLMNGKLNAIFNRKWFKGKKNEIDIKGRDFYDLFWYFQKGISPNWKSLKDSTGISSESQLKKKLLNIIDECVSSKKLSYDLKNFFPDQNFISDFCKNYKEIIKKYL